MKTRTRLGFSMLVTVLVLASAGGTRAIPAHASGSTTVVMGYVSGTPDVLLESGQSHPGVIVDYYTDNPVDPPQTVGPAAVPYGIGGAGWYGEVAGQHVDFNINDTLGRPVHGIYEIYANGSTLTATGDICGSVSGVPITPGLEDFVVYLLDDPPGSGPCPGGSVATYGAVVATIY